MKKKNPPKKLSLDPGLVRHYWQEFGLCQKVLDLGCGLGDLGKWKPNPKIEVFGGVLIQKFLKRQKTMKK